MSYYRIVATETCHCGAALTIDAYSADAERQLEGFRASHEDCRNITLGWIERREDDR